jgi:hypothetical protein
MNSKFEIGVMILVVFMFGLALGYAFPWKKKPKKEYPIEVQCYWSTSGYSSYPTMECDSIKGDTAWKDGNKITLKNVISVNFK